MSPSKGLPHKLHSHVGLTAGKISEPIGSHARDMFPTCTGDIRPYTSTQSCIYRNAELLMMEDFGADYRISGYGFEFIPTGDPRSFRDLFQG